ncbi:MAG: GWxTD domain-containing protein [candidate division WOR-3 bacterium]
MTVMVNLVLFLAAFGDTLHFDFDWAVFRHTADSVRIEFYYGIGFRELNFQSVDSLLVAPFRIEFSINGINRQFSESGTLIKRARLRSFQEAIVSHRVFVDQFSVIAPAGSYEVRTSVADSLHAGTVTDTITVPQFGDRLMLSSIQLGNALLADSLTQALAVIPNPGRRFVAGRNQKLYAYFETYGLNPQTRSYELRYYIVSGGGDDTIVRSAPIERPKSSSRSATALEINIDSLNPGSYELVVEAVDHPFSVQNRVIFNLVEAVTSQPRVERYQLQLTPHEQRYYQELQYIATPRELEYYNRLSPEGREAYLAWFWSRHNLSEFVRRMETVEGRFATARTPGIKTDRGRIYVKYGEPDAIERKTMEMEVKPREYWFYYQLGLTFIFIDIHGDGNYRLAWTNSPEEPKTGLEHLLTTEEQDLYH